MYNILAATVNFEFTHIELVNLEFTRPKLTYRLRIYSVWTSLWTWSGSILNSKHMRERGAKNEDRTKNQEFTVEEGFDPRRTGRTYRFD